jgi:hypothetical protein
MTPRGGAILASQRQRLYSDGALAKVAKLVNWVPVLRLAECDENLFRSMRQYVDVQTSKVLVVGFHVALDIRFWPIAEV